MTRYVNLMSGQARIREIQRTRLRQWTRVLFVVGAMLMLPTLVTWWPVHREGQRLAALQSQYEPIRQFIADNKSIRKKIDQIREQDRLALALTDETPVVTLLGLVGKAVANANGQVYVEQVRFEQSAHPWNEGSESLAAVTLDGMGVNNEAMTQLTSSLQSSLPFASVQLVSSETVAVNGQPRHSFTIKASF